MRKLLINLINFYQVFLSFGGGLFSIFAPGGACRYEVSCSEYTKKVIREIGVVRGIFLGLKRIWRCR